MPRTLRTLPRPREVLPAFALALLVAGCDGSTGPRPDSPVQFSRNISLPALHSRLESGPARVEIRLEPGGLTARKVSVREHHGLSRPEEIRGRISAISLDGDQGSVTFELGGVEIGFGAATKLHPRGGMGRGSGMAFAKLVTRIQADLDAGRHPVVTARRSPPTEPQAAGDASFTATELKLSHGADAPRLELNVAAENLVTNATPPPDGWLKVLGLSIELRASEGETELAAELPAARGAQAFEGVVRSVDPAAATVTLEGGTVVRIVAGTAIEPADAGDGQLTSLAAVQAALAAGRSVTVEGEGLGDAAGPLTLIAVEIEFQSGDR